MISSAGFSKHVFKKHVKLCHTYSEMSKGFWTLSESPLKSHKELLDLRFLLLHLITTVALSSAGILLACFCLCTCMCVCAYVWVCVCKRENWDLWRIGLCSSGGWRVWELQGRLLGSRPEKSRCFNLTVDNVMPTWFLTLYQINSCEFCRIGYQARDQGRVDFQLESEMAIWRWNSSFPRECLSLLLRLSIDCRRPPHMILDILL